MKKRLVSVIMMTGLIFSLIPIVSLPANAQSNSNAEYVYSYFLGRGYSKEASAAIVGNILWESGTGKSLDICLHTIEYATGEGIGMCQWSGSRKNSFKDFCSSNGVSWENSTVELQCSFLNKELNGDYGQQWCFNLGYSENVYQYNVTLNNFKQTSDIQLATGAFCFCFERPDESKSGIQTRIEYAKWIYSLFGGNAVSTPSNPGVSVSDGTYILESKMGGKAADVWGASQNSEANIELWTKNGKDNQKFRIQKSGDSYQITSVCSGLSMDVQSASSASGTNVWQYISNGSNAQRWVFEDAGNGYVYIRSLLGTYLDVYNGETADGTNIWAYQFNGSDAQKWRLIPCAESSVSVENGIYILESKLDSTKAADVYSGAKDSGTNIELWKKNGYDNQKFKIEKDGSNYKISAYHSGLSMDISEASTASGANVQQYQFWGDNNLAQKWVFEDAGNGYVYIHSLLGTYLDVCNGGTADGTNIWAYQFNGTDAQKWKLISADSKKETTTTTPTTTPTETTPAVSTNKKVKFSRQTIYSQGQFTDVPANQWFTDNVANAVEFGLMKGNSDTSFNPYGDVTLAEAITMAARIHSIYTTGAENFVQSGKWYQVYLDYAYQNGIISYAYYNCDVNHKATRAQFAEIFAAALPSEALREINTIADNAVPDVKTSASCGSAVYKLYRAGILSGGDATGTFSPATFITRAECATIVARMADSDNRVSFTL